MKIIGIASDHRGYKVKQELIEWLTTLGYEVKDFGTSSVDELVDYMDYADELCAWSKGKSFSEAVGILICGSGVGMGIAANRHSHIRAAVLTSPYIAEESREHSDANVAVLPAEVLSIDEQKAMIKVFLDTKFLGLERYQRRIKKLNGAFS